MKLFTGWITAVGICTLSIAGCSADAVETDISESSNPMLLQALRQIQIDYQNAGKSDTYDDLLKDYTPTLQYCKQGLVVNFLPKRSRTVDGDFSLLISKDTGAVSDPNFGLDGCLPL